MVAFQLREGSARELRVVGSCCSVAVSSFVFFLVGAHAGDCPLRWSVRSSVPSLWLADMPTASCRAAGVVTGSRGGALRPSPGALLLVLGLQY